MSNIKKYLCVALLTFVAACGQQQTTPSHDHAGCKKECASCCKEACANCEHCQQAECACPHCATHHRTNKAAHELLHKKTGNYPSCEKHHQ